MRSYFKQLSVCAAGAAVLALSLIGVSNVARRSVVSDGPITFHGLGLVPRLEASYVPTAIKSVQYGSVALASASSGTATITSVSTANSIVQYLGVAGGIGSGVGSATQSQFQLHVSLTNATTVTVSNSGSATTITANFVVVEFRPGILKSNAQYSLATTGNSTTKTITSVNAAKSFLVYQGSTVGSGSQTIDDNCAWSRVTLTNATTVTATVNTYNAGGCGSPTPWFQVAEFF